MTRGRAGKPAIPVVRRVRWAAPLLCALLWLVSPRGAVGAEISVDASVDRTRVAIGEPVVLTIEVSGTQNAAAPDLGDVSGFQAQYLGPSTQISIVNGRMSASISHRYRLTPQRAGNLQIGPFSVEVEGRSYRTEPVRIAVSAGAPPAAGGAPAEDSRDLRLQLTLPKNELYVGEQVSLEVALLVGNVAVDDLQYPKITGPGVVVDRLSEPDRRTEIAGGRRFQVLRFDTTLTAVRPGSIALSAAMGMNRVVQRAGRRGDPFFDRLFNPTEKRPITLRAEPVSLTVLPLPQEGRPADFSGAVGDFDFQLDAKPTELAVGDPITVRLEISGGGSLSGVAPPAIPGDERFHVYDPTPSKEEETPRRRVFEQVVLPRQPGAYPLPAVSFSFFDPQARRYRTVTRGPIPLHVAPSAAGTAPKMVEAPAPSEGAERAETLGRDIVYIKDEPGALRPLGRPLHRRWWFLALQALPPFAFLVLVVAARRRDRLAADPRLLRYRRAGREARRALAALNGAAGSGPELYDRLAAVLSAYLEAKLDLPPGAIERQRVVERLRRSGASDAVRERVESFFDLVEHARYAAADSAASQRETALRLAGEIIDGLESRRDRFAGLARTWSLLLLAACLLPLHGSSAGGAGRGEPKTAFFRGNAAYQEGRNEDAIRAYESVLEAGRASGALFFNLGNAYFRTGRLGRAVLEYERAARLLPRDADVRANLSYARQEAGLEAPAEPLWTRVAFPLASRFSVEELALAAAVLWLGLWVLLGARLLMPRFRAGLGRGAWIAVTLLLIVGASLGARVWRTELKEVGVVVAGGTTAVRFEPSPDATEHFRLTEGSSVVVDEQREDWYRIRRRDGRRGWVTRSAVALVDGEVQEK